MNPNSDAPDSGEYFGRDLEAMSFAVNYHHWIMDRFRPYVGRHLLEIGAGTGNFSEFLLQSQPQSLTALEPSSNMFPLLHDRLASHPGAVAINDFFGARHSDLPTTPDTVFYVNVLEHIEDDAAELAYVHESLRTGGHLCIFVPALPWLYGTADAAVGHFRRYRRGELLNRVQDAGFEVLHCRYFDIAGVLPWWLLFRVLRREAVSAGQVDLYDRWIVPVMRRIEGWIPPPIGKNLILVARKND
ncbi:MAG: class I SAM-dependent methyltransferase [Chromatiales bacterium]|nr:class I SAM-dependent methyltransferase [Chromatiales bacterium]